MLRDDGASPRLVEIIRAAAEGESSEYIGCVDEGAEGIPAVAAYGMIAGTIGTAAFYGLAPLARAGTPAGTRLVEFAIRDLKRLGARQIVAEFPESEDHAEYGKVLRSSGFDAVGRVEDFYRDGTGMLILVKTQP